jgi:hypothetical protein
MTGQCYVGFWERLVSLKVSYDRTIVGGSSAILSQSPCVDAIVRLPEILRWTPFAYSTVTAVHNSGLADP